MPKGLFKPQRITADIPGYPSLTIQSTFSGKGRIKDGKGRDVGETKRTTPIKRTYTGSIEESAMGEMPLILFFALVHTFWCGFHRN